MQTLVAFPLETQGAVGRKQLVREKSERGRKKQWGGNGPKKKKKKKKAFV